MTKPLALITPDVLSDEAVSDLIDCAGYGIADWAASGTEDKVRKTYRVVEASAYLEDQPAKDEELSYQQLREAFAALANAGELPFWQMREIEDQELAFDSDVADLVVQHALFGETVYG